MTGASATATTIATIASVLTDIVVASPMGARLGAVVGRFKRGGRIGPRPGGCQEPRVAAARSALKLQVGLIVLIHGRLRGLPHDDGPAERRARAPGPGQQVADSRVLPLGSLRDVRRSLGSL